MERPAQQKLLDGVRARKIEALSLCSGLSISWSGKRNFAG